MTNNNIRTAVREYFRDRSTSVVKYGPINMWNVSEVTNMMLLFQYITEFSEDDDISEWDVSNVTIMSYMFADCENFNQDISKWVVDNTANLSEMFELSPLRENNPKEYFNLKSFLNNENIMDAVYSFLETEIIQEYGEIKDWDVSRVTNMSSLFYSFRQEVDFIDNSQSLIGIGRCALNIAVPVAP